MMTEMDCRRSGTSVDLADGADVSIVTRFIQGERTYETYIQDDREGTSKTLPSSDFSEIGTGKETERIVPLYISYRKLEQ